MRGVPFCPSIYPYDGAWRNVGKKIKIGENFFSPIPIHGFYCISSLAVSLIASSLAPSKFVR